MTNLIFYIHFKIFNGSLCFVCLFLNQEFINVNILQFIMNFLHVWVPETHFFVSCWIILGMIVFSIASLFCFHCIPVFFLYRIIIIVIIYKEKCSCRQAVVRLCLLWCDHCIPLPLGDSLPRHSKVPVVADLAQGSSLFGMESIPRWKQDSRVTAITSHRLKTFWTTLLQTQQPPWWRKQKEIFLHHIKDKPNRGGDILSEQQKISSPTHTN